MSRCSRDGLVRVQIKLRRWRSFCLRPFPREAYKVSNSALPLYSVRCTPAPPILHIGYPCPLLPPPLMPSVDQPGPDLSETALSDPSQPARPRSESRSESAGPVRVFQPDPSHPDQFEPARTDPGLCLVQILFASLHSPARSGHDGHRSASTTSRGSEAIEPSLGAGGGAGAGGALPHPRRAAVRRGFNSRGLPRVVLG